MTSRRGIVTAFRTGFILAAWTEGGQQNGKPALAPDMLAFATASRLETADGDADTRWRVDKADYNV